MPGVVIIPWIAMTNPTRMIAVVIKSKNINRLIRILHALIMNLPVAPMIVFHSLGFAIPPLIAKMGQMKMLHFAGLKLKLLVCIDISFIILYIYLFKFVFNRVLPKPRFYVQLFFPNA